MKTFLHPFVEVITVVFVVTVEDAVFITSVLSREVVFVSSKTFFGARSNGLKKVLLPESVSSSTIIPSWSVLSSLLASERLLLPEVRLETEEFLVGCVLFDDISDATSAALTSGLREFQVSKIDIGKRGLGKVEASSLHSQAEEETR